jgi:hypothetical protein
MATLVELKRNYYIAQLGLPEDTKLTLTDLEYAFFLDPPEGGGGEGGDPAMGGDLTGTASNAQIAAGAVGGTEIDAAIKDPVAGTAGLRTLGTGAQQAAQGSLTEYVANKAQANGYAGLGANTRVPAAQLGTGAAATTYLAGDQTYKDPAVGGDLTGTVSNAQIAAGAVGATETSSAIEKTANKGAASGYADLDSSSLLPISRLPAGSTLIVRKVSGNWPGGDADTGVRPTARTDIVVNWVGPDPSPDIVASGTGGMLDNVDLRSITQ